VLRHVQITSYVTALREGGSLPGLVEGDDDGTYVAKFHGAGQGSAALVAEIVVGELARRLGVRVPELVTLELDPQIGKREPDPEIQELLVASAGLNLGLDFLPGSTGYDGISWQAPAREAAVVRWLDAFTANIDRTWRNPNLLIWHGQLWAIDHGAALIFQHAWPPVTTWAGRRYDLSQHVLGTVANSLEPAALAALDSELTAAVTAPALTEIMALVPDEFLLGMNAALGDPRDATAWRERYLEYLLARADPSATWREATP
jgi:hypothetical protein